MFLEKKAKDRTYRTKRQKNPKFRKKNKTDRRNTDYMTFSKLTGFTNALSSSSHRHFPIILIPRSSRPRHEQQDE